MKPKKTAKLEEVAQAAGVSKMTVSLAIRGGEHVRRMSPETRERVLRIAKDLNYAPDARARALRLGRSNVIGLYAGHGFVNVREPFFTEIVSGLQEGCEEVKKDLLLHRISHGSSDTIYEEFVDGRIDGLVVTMPATDPLLQTLVRSRLPAVAVADFVPGLPAIVADDVEGARLIAEHLFQRGHRNVIYAITPLLPTSSRRRRDTFLEVAGSLGMNVRVEPAPYLKGDDQLVKDAIASGVTAIACWNDSAARRLMQTCVELDVKIPDQLAITGFDGFQGAFGDLTPLTTIEAPWAEAARLAVRSVDSILRGQAPPAEVVLPVRLLLGSTT